MPRAKTHKIAVQTKGLNAEDGARLHYLIACAASAFTDEYQRAGNVPLKVLRATFPTTVVTSPGDRTGSIW